MYRNGLHYDLQYSNYYDDCIFYDSILEMEPSPLNILEMGCGTGRLSERFISKGHKLWGVDFQQDMINIAEQKCPKGIFFCSDMRYFQLDIKFDYIIFPFNTFIHLQDYQDFYITLKNAKSLLATNGKIILDNINPSLKLLCRNINEVQTDSVYFCPECHSEVVVQFASQYERSSQKLLVKRTWITKNTNKILYSEKMHYQLIFPNEMRTNLQFAGLKSDKVFGDYVGNSFTSESDLMLVICKSL